MGIAKKTGENSQDSQKARLIKQGLFYLRRTVARRNLASGVYFLNEVKEPIEDLAVDSIILVRTMGIILDNWIEIPKQGRISVAWFEDSKAAQIIVQNYII